MVLREGPKVNASKTQLIVFGSRQNLRSLPNFEVTFRDTKLIPCNEVKNLGVIFDRNLSWDSHVGAVSRRCTGILLDLSHVRHVIPQGVITSLVTALVLSQVRYYISVYGIGSKKKHSQSSEGPELRGQSNLWSKKIRPCLGPAGETGLAGG